MYQKCSLLIQTCFGNDYRLTQIVSKWVMFEIYALTLATFNVPFNLTYLTQHTNQYTVFWLSHLIFFFYSVSISGHQGALGISMPHESLGAGQVFGLEFVLTFLIIFTIFATFENNRRLLSNDSLSIGLAYTVGSLAGVSWKPDCLTFLFINFKVNKLIACG